jgi:uncharacterized DUF497 family protein
MQCDQLKISTGSSSMEWLIWAVFNPFIHIIYPFITYFCSYYSFFMFEFDKSKSKSNMQKHGIDFDTAKKLWDDPNRVEIPGRSIDEPRFILIARLNQDLRTTIFTVRNRNTRIISVRKSREDEKEIYDSIGI